MLKFLVAVLLLAVPMSSVADLYRYEDEEGVVHFTDAPEDKRFQLFMESIKKKTHKANKPTKPSVPPPIPGKYLYKDISPADGLIYAVKQTNVKGAYYWYLGADGSYLVKCTGDSIIIGDGVAKVAPRNGEVVIENVWGRTVWLDGTIGHKMYEVTMNHAATH